MGFPLGWRGAFRDEALGEEAALQEHSLRSLADLHIQPRHAHTIDTACPILTTWGIDITEHRQVADVPQPIFGIIDHGSRRVLKIETLRNRSSIDILRILLDAIEHYGKPKKIRTDNEAIFNS